MNHGLSGANSCLVWSARDEPWSGIYLMRLRILFEVVEDGLPSASLHFDRIRAFGFERFYDFDVITLLCKIDRHLSSVTNGICDVLVWRDLVIDTGKIESKAAVLCFHPGKEFTARSQVIFGTCRMPVVRSGTPLCDVFGSRPILPDFF